MIACLGETTGVETLNILLNLMKSSAEGIQILTDRPRINSKTIDLNALERLPPNTFGYAYKKFLDDNVSSIQILTLQCNGINFKCRTFII